MFSTSTSRRLALAAAVLCLALPAAAQADSIVYVDGGNVWTAKPDGSGRVQLTDGGRWHSPTQADDGTIAAVDGTGGVITIMAKDGRPLRTVTTAMQKSSAGTTFAASPVELSFSPDGGKLAYSYVQYGCGVGTSCGATPDAATFVTDAAGPNATARETYGANTGVSNPEWLTNSRLIAFGGFNVGGALIDVPGPEYGRAPWIYTQQDVSDGEVSRDGKHVAVLTDYGPNLHLQVATTSDDPRTTPQPADATPSCDGGKDAQLGDPTWSPDGLSLALKDSEGIRVLRFSAITANHCDLASEALVLPATASEPDWGPADPPAARYVAKGPDVPGDDGQKVDPATPARVSLPAGRVSRSALKRGRATLKVTVDRAGSVTVGAKAGGTTVGTGRAAAKQAGTVAVRLKRPTRKAARKLRRAKALKVSVRLTPATGTPVTTTQTLRLR